MSEGGDVFLKYAHYHLLWIQQTAHDSYNVVFIDMIVLKYVVFIDMIVLKYCRYLL
jgi:hypothetical protein